MEYDMNDMRYDFIFLSISRNLKKTATINTKNLILKRREEINTYPNTYKKVQ